MAEIRHIAMTQQHPDLADEQAYVDYAYECLERPARPPGGCGTSARPTSAARSRPATSATSSTRPLVNRLTISTSARPRWSSAASTGSAETPDGARELPHRAAGGRRRGLASRSSSTGGRRSPSRSTGPPAASRWASPAAATSPSRAARCSGIEDELFGDGHLGVGHDDGLDDDDETVASRPALRGLQHAARRARARPHRPARRHRRHHPGRAGRDHPLARRPACSSCRAARAPARRSSPCTAPRTCSTRYRFPLEDQGVLVIGPNRVFLRYIERVLPSLGEAGVEQVVLADLVPDVDFAVGVDPADAPLAATVKGDVRMADVIDQGRARPRAAAARGPRRAVPHRLPAAARRRVAAHRAAARSAASAATTPAAASSRARSGRRWPRRWRDGDGDRAARCAKRCAAARGPRRARADVAGAHAGAAAARPVRLARRCCASPPQACSSDDEYRRAVPAALATTSTTCAGPTPTSPCSTRPASCSARSRAQRQGRRRRRDPHLRPHRRRRGAGPHADAAADGRPPLAERVDDRRRRHRPGHRRARRPTTGTTCCATCPTASRRGSIGLSVGYRIPAQIMALANRVMRAATPALRAPTAFATATRHPQFVQRRLADLLGVRRPSVARARPTSSPTATSRSSPPTRWSSASRGALDAAGIDHGRAATHRARRSASRSCRSAWSRASSSTASWWSSRRDRRADEHGLRALYVALTRSTQRLTVVHHEPLPAAMV